MGRLDLLILATALAWGVAAVPAQGPVYKRFELRYDTHKAGARAGVVFEVEQHDTSEGEQPPVVRRNVIRLARGTEIDTGALPRCRATDEELQQGGWKICPPRSQVGEGEADVF